MVSTWLSFVTLTLLLIPRCSFAEQRAVIDRLLELSRPGADTSILAVELRRVFTAENIRSGAAWAGHGKDFVWAVESSSQPVLFINDKQFADMKRIGDSNLWYYTGVLPVGDAYKFHYKITSEDFGGFLNVPAYTPESYAQPGVPEGKLSEKMTSVSKIYLGMETNYWIYTPPLYDGKTALPLMIWQDGERLVGRNKEETCILCPSLVRILEVTENLIHQKKLPPMAHLFIQAGTLGGRSMRSVQYDSVTDRYPRFLIEEILPQVYAKYNIRKDGYSHGIQGQSSGGICAFNAGWHRPDQFSRIASQHGTFTSVAFRNKEPEAAHVIPTWVRRQPKKNLRVWISDGSEDYENEWGSWPLQNLQLANSLKFRVTIFVSSWGTEIITPPSGPLSCLKRSSGYGGTTIHRRPVRILWRILPKRKNLSFGLRFTTADNQSSAVFVTVAADSYSSCDLGRNSRDQGTEGRNTSSGRSDYR